MLPLLIWKQPRGIKEVAPNRAVGETRVQSLSFDNLEDVSQEKRQGLGTGSKAERRGGHYMKSWRAVERKLR